MRIRLARRGKKQLISFKKWAKRHINYRKHEHSTRLLHFSHWAHNHIHNAAARTRNGSEHDSLSNILSSGKACSTVGQALMVARQQQKKYLAWQHYQHCVHHQLQSESQHHLGKQPRTCLDDKPSRRERRQQ